MQYNGAWTQETDASGKTVKYTCRLSNLDTVPVANATVILKSGNLIGAQDIALNISDGTVVGSGEPNALGCEFRYSADENVIELYFKNPLADANHPTGITSNADFVLVLVSLDGIEYRFEGSVTLMYIDVE